MDWLRWNKLCLHHQQLPVHHTRGSSIGLWVGDDCAGARAFLVRDPKDLLSAGLCLVLQCGKHPDKAAQPLLGCGVCWSGQAALQKSYQCWCTAREIWEWLDKCCYSFGKKIKRTIRWMLLLLRKERNKSFHATLPINNTLLRDSSNEK